MKNIKKSVLLSLIAAMTIWSMSFIWTKQAFVVFSPITTIFLRLIVSSILIFGYLHFTKQFQKIEKRDYFWILLLGILEPFLYFMGESFGLQLIPSTLASVIICTIPLFTPLLGFIVFRERMTYMNVAGIVISVIGVMVMVVDKNLSLNAPLKGILLMGLAVFSATCYALVLKHLSHRYSGCSIVAYQNTVGIFLFLPFFTFNEWSTFISTPVTFSAVSAVIMLAVFASTVAFILYTHGIKDLGVTKASAFVNLIPVLTAIFAWFILDEQIGWRKIFGIAIVISGLFASQFKNKEQDDIRPFEA